MSKSKTPKSYYSIVVKGEDCNYPSEVFIERHDNGIMLSEATMKKMFNHFPNKKAASIARKAIVAALASK